MAVIGNKRPQSGTISRVRRGNPAGAITKKEDRIDFPAQIRAGDERPDDGNYSRLESVHMQTRACSIPKLSREKQTERRSV